MEHDPNFFPNVRRAVFIKRLNRFLVECFLDSKKIIAHLPNPGRMWELLLPETVLYLVKNPPSDFKKTQFTVVAVDKEAVPVLLHTQHTNTVARRLISEKRLTGLEAYRVIQEEITIGNSRFDFLLQGKSHQMVLEVKSCTLFSGSIAMFPDAITLRGTKHLLKLAELAQQGFRSGVLFLVHYPLVDYFLPDYHTDIDFARTLSAVRNIIKIKTFAVGWNEDMTFNGIVKELHIPWDLLEREARDRGTYIVILYLDKKASISVGGLGEVVFQKGYYLYVGSAQKNLRARLERHRRKRKKLFWHIDYLRERADFIAAVPFRGTLTRGCVIAGALKHISDWSITSFGSSDCSCASHLFGMNKNPLTSSLFIQMLLHFRIDVLRDML